MSRPTVWVIANLRIFCLWSTNVVLGAQHFDDMIVSDCLVGKLMPFGRLCTDFAGLLDQSEAKWKLSSRWKEQRRPFFAEGRRLEAVALLDET